jgi:hypothetical protein
MAASSLKLLFDENFSHKQVGFVANESRLAPMQHMRKIGWSGRPDPEWIPLAVQQGFVIISGDRNDKTRGYTVADLKAMHARVLLVGEFFDHMSGWDKAKWLVAQVERLVDLAGKLPKGAVTLVSKVGTATPL